MAVSSGSTVNDIQVRTNMYTWLQLQAMGRCPGWSSQQPVEVSRVEVVANLWCSQIDVMFWKWLTNWTIPHKIITLQPQ